MASLEMVESGDHLSPASKNEIKKYYGKSHFILFFFCSRAHGIVVGKKNPNYLPNLCVVRFTPLKSNTKYFIHPTFLTGQIIPLIHSKVIYVPCDIQSALKLYRNNGPTEHPYSSSSSIPSPSTETQISVAHLLARLPRYRPCWGLDPIGEPRGGGGHRRAKHRARHLRRRPSLFGTARNLLYPISLRSIS